MGVFRLKPEGLNADDLELELIDFGLEELSEGSAENGEPVLVLRCVVYWFWQNAEGIRR